MEISRVFLTVSVLFLLFLVLGSCSTQRDQPVTSSAGVTEKIVIVGGTLIDGTGREPVENAAVIIEGKRIKEVLTDGGKYEPEPNTKVIRADGKFVLPGFIDGHVHYQGWAAPLYLSQGITSIIDTANVTAWILTQKWAIDQGLISGPRIFTCGGQIDSPPGTFDWAILVSTEEEARAAVREHARKGVDCIKTYTMLPKNLIKAIVEEAHAAGIPVRGHITISALEAAEFGMDGLEHVSGVPIAMIGDPEKLQEIKRRRTETEYLVSRPTLSSLWYYAKPEEYDRIIRDLIENDVFITPTLTAYWIGVHSYNEEFAKENEMFAHDPRKSFIPSWSREGMLRQYPHFMDVMADPKLKVGYANIQKFIKSFVDAGGKVVAGPDTSLLSTHGLDFHRELQLLLEAGLSPMQVLQAGTRNPAELIRKADDLGTIEPGKLADLVIIDGDPLEDIRNTRKIDTVIKEGKVLDITYDSHFLDAIPRPLSEDQRERYEARTFKK